MLSGCRSHLSALHPFRFPHIGAYHHLHPLSRWPRSEPLLKMFRKSMILPVLAPIASPSAEAVSALPAAGVIDGTLPSKVPYHTFKNTKKKTTKCYGDHSLDQIICSECKEKRRLRLIMENQERLKAQKSNIFFQATHLASTIDHFLDCASPQSVHINSADILSSILSPGIASVLLNPPELPQSTLRRLLSCPNLMKLQVDNWILTSINEAIFDLSCTTELPLQMQIFHLPVKDPFARVLRSRYSRRWRDFIRTSSIPSAPCRVC